MRPAPAILSGSLASAALVAAFACAVAVVHPGGGEPTRWNVDVSASSHDPGLRLPAPSVAAGVVPWAGAVPVLAAPTPAPVRSATASRPAPRSASPVDEVVKRPKTPTAAAPLPATSAPVAPPDASTPAPDASQKSPPTPTLTETAGSAIAASARSAGDAVAPASPQAGDAVAATGQAAGDAVAGLGP